jgi:hypothetical protein
VLWSKGPAAQSRSESKPVKMYDKAQHSTVLLLKPRLHEQEAFSFACMLHVCTLPCTTIKKYKQLLEHFLETQATTRRLTSFRKRGPPRLQHTRIVTHILHEYSHASAIDTGIACRENDVLAQGGLNSSLLSRNVHLSNASILRSGSGVAWETACMETRRNQSIT